MEIYFRYILFCILNFQTNIEILLVECKFVPVSQNECPSNVIAIYKLPECDHSMSNGELCEANRPLPDGNKNYNVDNCKTHTDVFKCVKGTYLK